MKVLFLKDVGGVGQRGTMKEVADGYGFNFLISRGLAVQATAEKVKEYEAQAKLDNAEKEKKAGEINKAVYALEGQRFEMKVRATEKGGLFKSISVSDIEKVLKADIPHDAIKLEKPIKEIGDHKIKISASGAESTITLAISSV